MAADNGVSSQVYKLLNSAVTPTTAIPAPVSPSHRVENYAQVFFMRWENELAGGDKITVSDSQQQIAFRASRECNDGYTTGLLCDHSGEVIVSIKKKEDHNWEGRPAEEMAWNVEQSFRKNSAWVAYRGEDAEVSFTVVREELPGISPTFEISFMGDPSMTDFIVVGNVLKHNFTIMYNDSPVAKVQNLLSSKENGYKITVYRGMDIAFIISLLLIINKFPEEAGRLPTRTSSFSRRRKVQENDTNDPKTMEAALEAHEEDRRPTRSATFPRARKAHQKETDDASSMTSISHAQQEVQDHQIETATCTTSQWENDNRKKIAPVPKPLPMVPVTSSFPVGNLTQFLLVQKNRFFDETVIPLLVSLANRYTSGQQGCNRILCYEFPHPHSLQQAAMLSSSWTTTADSGPQLPIFSPVRAALMVALVILVTAVLLSVLGAVITAMAALVNLVIGMFMVIGMALGAIVVLGVGLAVIVGVVTGSPMGLVAKGDAARGTAELHMRKFSGRFRYHLSNGSRMGILELKYRRFNCTFNFPL